MVVHIETRVLWGRSERIQPDLAVPGWHGKLHVCKVHALTTPLPQLPSLLPNRSIIVHADVPRTGVRAGNDNGPGSMYAGRQGAGSTGAGAGRPGMAPKRQGAGSGHGGNAGSMVWNANRRCGNKTDAQGRPVCNNCGSPDHLWATCPRPKPPPQARTGQHG